MSEQPTKIHPTAPTLPPARTEPVRPAHGGPPGQPPYLPPTGGGGGGGGGGDEEQPPDDTTARRLGIAAVVLAALVVVLAFLLVRDGTNKSEPTPASTPRATPQTQTPSTTTPSATPAPDPTTSSPPPAASNEPSGGGTPVPGPEVDRDAAGQEEESGPLMQPGEVTELTVAEGEPIRFRVTVTNDDEVTVDGYGVTEPVGGGETVAIEIPSASRVGVFAVKLAGTDTTIGRIVVEP